MKKIYGFAALCAAMTLASCSNENEPNVTPSGSKMETQTAYIAVSLATPATDTRAITYENGDASLYESDAKSAVFAYFDGNGEFIGVTDEIPLDGWKPYTGSESIEKYTSTLVKVEQPTSQVVDKKIKYIMAVVNCPADVKSYLDAEYAKESGRDNMVTMRKKVGAYTATTVGEDASKKGAFVMTNSAYGTGDAVTYLTECSDNVYNNPGDAQNNPSAIIYVERVLARVDAKFPEDEVLTNTAEPEVGNITTDGYSSAIQKISIKITGFEVANMATQSHLVKDLSNNGSYPLNDWYTAGEHRSHWATMPTTMTWSNQSYNKIAVENFSAKGTKNPLYIQENVDANNVSSILITAQLCDEQGNELKDLYRLTGNGKYYTENAAKVAAQGYLQADGYRISKEAGKYESVPVEDIVFVDNKNKGWDGHVEITLGAGEKLYQVVGTTYSEMNVAEVNAAFKAGSIASINNALSSEIGEDGKPVVTDTYRYGVRKWATGKCYYYKNIAGVNGADGNPLAGIVRNHIYRLNLNSVAGLGIPVFDPTEDIIPNDPPKIDPKDDWYLNAKINILQWGVYTQDVNFETPNE